VFNLHLDRSGRDRHGAQCNEEEYDSNCKRVADAIGAPVDEFKLQLEDMKPRALHELNSNSKSRDNIKPAWKSAVEKVNVHRSVALNHPTNLIVGGLILYNVIGISSSGVEHNFQKSNYGYSNRRQHASEETEEYCLKVLLDLSHHDLDEVIRRARKVWLILYGSCRNQITNCNAGVSRPRPASTEPGDFMADSETAFIRKRRAAANEQAHNSSGAASSMNADHLMQSAADHGHLPLWEEGHDKELNFQTKKWRSRKVQAVAEGMLEGDDALHHEVRVVKSGRLKLQMARVRKHARDAAAVAGISRHEARKEIQGKSVHIDKTVPASHRPGLSAAIRHMRMNIVSQNAADVFVVPVPGNAPTSTMVAAALRGSYQVSVTAMMTYIQEGTVLKWSDVAHIPRTIFVSNACHALQRAGIEYIQSILDSVPGNKVGIRIGGWDTLVALRATYKKVPSRVIALVNHDELTNPVFS
jgi:hypothetical protein